MREQQTKKSIIQTFEYAEERIFNVFTHQNVIDVTRKVVCLKKQQILTSNQKLQ